MKIVNFTPFPHLVFESRLPDDRRLGVVVVRGTFRIVPGEALRPVPLQEKVLVTDVYRGERGASSLAAEADLAPYKPRADIHVNAVAHAPGTAPATSWPVRIQVGAVRKDMQVVGPSVWQHFRLGGWRKTAPVACRTVPLSYEHAFGGTYVVDGKTHYDPRNPVGTGWIDQRLTPRDRDIAAPQVLAQGEPEHRPDKRHVPQGCGPLSPNWEPRLGRAGTFDETWERERWPRLPADFAYAFYNSAHPDLIHPGHLAGHEEVCLVHLSAEHAVLGFRLPGYALMALTFFEGGVACPIVLGLDTVHIDVTGAALDEHRVALTWRGVFPKLRAFMGLELRLDHPGRRADQPERRAMEATIGH